MRPAKNQQPRAASEAPQRPRDEQLYEPPAVVWEESLSIESNLAGACAKFGPQGGACTAANKS
jgi:hypothetical protein